MYTRYALYKSTSLLFLSGVFCLCTKQDARVKIDSQENPKGVFSVIVRMFCAFKLQHTYTCTHTQTPYAANRGVYHPWTNYALTQPPNVEPLQLQTPPTSKLVKWGTPPYSQHGEPTPTLKMLPLTYWPMKS